MKTLLLLRHAKSSWKDSALPDRLRPLNSRGRSAAVSMGRLLERESLWPEQIFCSSAERTRRTCERLLKAAESAIPVQFRDDLYHCSAEGISQVLQETSNSVARVMVIGHNPELAEFLADVAGFSEKFPTAGLAVLTIDIANWSELRPRQPMTLDRLWRPRDLE
jgi:phosphohistidine phosphatase